MISKFIEKIIQNLKSEPNYKIDKKISTTLIFQITMHRGFSYIRGLFYEVLKGKKCNNLFLGKHVKILQPQLVKFGKSVIIEDYVVIDSLSQNGVIIGDNVTIAKFSTMQCTGIIKNLGVGLKIGDNSAIGAYSFLGAQGQILIGKNVIIGPRVSIFSENHKFNDIQTPIRLQNTTRKGVTIEDDCWIGSGSIILDGVNIGHGCVIAAGSVVTKSISSYSVAAGVPARVIKRRNKL